jgi:hypothetical protein
MAVIMYFSFVSYVVVGTPGAWGQGFEPSTYPASAPCHISSTATGSLYLAELPQCARRELRTTAQVISPSGNGGGGGGCPSAMCRRSSPM